jgi:hypothetical protein
MLPRSFCWYSIGWLALFMYAANEIELGGAMDQKINKRAYFCGIVEDVRRKLDAPLLRRLKTVPVFPMELQRG